MELSTLQSYENAVITIMRRLPGERQRELFDFAQFLESRTTGQANDSEEDTKWELTSCEARILTGIRKYGAREAREEYRTGKTTAIAITDDGRLAPE